jgi:cobalamin synthase
LTPRRLWQDFLVAVQFLTRIPVPAHEFDHTSLARAAFSFPLVGLLIGATAASFYRLLEPHLDRVVVSLSVVLLSTMPLWDVIPYLIAAHVLCRWTVLPLGYALAPARAEHDGQGARLAQRTSRNVLLVGTLMALLLSVFVLRRRAIAPLVATLLVTWLTGRFYRSTIGGVTGDCFGATMQLTEIAVYLCAAWKPGAHLA